MDNGAGRNMAETVYGTEDSTMVMSEKVNREKSIDRGCVGRGRDRNHTERKSPGKIKSDDLPCASSLISNYKFR